MVVFFKKEETIDTYSKTEIDNKLENIKVPDVYTKEEVDDKISDINIPDTYTKQEINSMISDIDIPDTYTKEQIDDKLSNIDLSDIYTKEEVDSKLESIDIPDSYTKQEIDNKLENISLDNVYTKEEVDDKIKDIDIPDTYTKEQINTMISDIDIPDSYTKQEVDDKLESIGALDTLYSNPNEVPADLGGISKGTTFDKVSFSGMFDDLLYPYQSPEFTTFRLDGLDTLNFEVGQTFVGGEHTFTWSIKNRQNTIGDSIVCNGIEIEENIDSSTQELLDMVKTNVATHTYNINGKTTQNKSFSKTLSLNWRFKRFFGVSPNAELTDDEIKSFQQELSTTRSKTVSYDCTGGNYFYFIYPQAFGDIADVKVFNSNWNDYTLVRKSFINQFGVTIPVNIYRSNNIVNGLVTVSWS